MRRYGRTEAKQNAHRHSSNGEGIKNKRSESCHSFKLCRRSCIGGRTCVGTDGQGQNKMPIAILRMAKA